MRIHLAISDICVELLPSSVSGSMLFLAQKSMHSWVSARPPAAVPVMVVMPKIRGTWSTWNHYVQMEAYYDYV